MSFVKEFKDFAMKGNVLDLAVATVLGAAFNNIVGAVVDNILMPVIGMMTGGVDFDRLAFKVGDASMKYGTAITATVKFMAVAFFLFLVIKASNRIKNKKEAAGLPEPSGTDQLLKDILDELKKK